jgi:hypothetical protein
MEDFGYQEFIIGTGKNIKNDEKNVYILLQQ